MVCVDCTVQDLRIHSTVAEDLSLLGYDALSWGRYVLCDIVSHPRKLDSLTPPYFQRCVSLL
jgi:hypothetical protein